MLFSKRRDLNPGEDNEGGEKALGVGSAEQKWPGTQSWMDLMKMTHSSPGSNH